MDLVQKLSGDVTGRRTRPYGGGYESERAECGARGGCGAGGRIRHAVRPEQPQAAGVGRRQADRVLEHRGVRGQPAGHRHRGGGQSAGAPRRGTAGGSGRLSEGADDPQRRRRACGQHRGRAGCARRGGHPRRREDPDPRRGASVRRPILDRRVRGCARPVHGGHRGVRLHRHGAAHPRPGRRQGRPVGAGPSPRPSAPRPPRRPSGSPPSDAPTHWPRTIPTSTRPTTPASSSTTCRTSRSPSWPAAKPT